jgi:cold shock CspA family protein/enamine deaminase RidA (YjgF/YER057c/UK114 family)
MEASVFATPATTPEEKLLQLGIVLPPPCEPGGKYLTAVTVGSLLFVSGHAADCASPPVYTGKVTGTFAPPLPSADSGVQRGRVKWFTRQKNYGFIESVSGGPDVFVHRAALDAADLRGLTADQTVDFTVEPGPEGKLSVAGNLKVVEMPPAPPPGMLSPELARESAQQTAIAVLSTVKAAVGELSRIKRLVLADGVVNCTEDFVQLSGVMDGFSELLAEVLGERGIGARSVTGAHSLPGGVPFEVTECIFELCPSVFISVTVPADGEEIALTT